MTWSHAFAAMVVVCMSGLLAWFFVDPSFYVYEAQIQGTVLADAEEVYRVSKLHEQSIFYVKPQDVSERICSALPGVQQAQVQCSMPNRVAVQIAEQEVRLLWRTMDQTFLVGALGRVMQIDDGTHGSVPTIVDSDNRPLKPGDQVPLAALQTVYALQRLLPEVKTFSYAEATGVSLRDARGWSIVIGDAASLPEKVASMQALLQRIASRGDAVELIDLRFVGSPYYR